MPDPTELWSIRDVAAHLGVKAASARGTLSRRGIRAVRYEIGPSGRPEARFDPAQVRKDTASRPGRGHRSDLPQGE